MKVSIKDVLNCILDNYDEDSIDLNVAKNWIEIHVYDYEAKYSGVILFRLVGPHEKHSEIGIHIHSLQNADELSYHVGDALHSCERDGFETVFIHSN